MITVTGCKDVISYAHIPLIKDGCVLCNAGHFDNEISKKALDSEAVNVTRVREFVDKYEMKDGRMVYLVSEGRLMNLAAGQGHPVEIMDMSFATQRWHLSTWSTITRKWKGRYMRCRIT